ncbi:MAG: SDR family NAD(P)-dependent oxidoreductase [Polyangiaceae bacterium]
MSDFFGGATVLVTGASSGIGVCFARLLAPKAKKLILVARREERLRTLAAELTKASASLEVVVEPCDLGNVAATRAFATRIAAAHEIDVLVNNAGVGDFSTFDMSNLDKLVQMIDLNITGLVALTHAVSKTMVARRGAERKRGILNVSSGFGLSFAPGMAAYIGTKYFVTGFTEALRADLSGTGVHVTQLCPGPVPTEFEENAGNFTGHKVPKVVEVSAEACAEKGLRGLARNRAMVIPGLIIKFALMLGRYSPWFITRIVMGYLGRKVRAIQVEAMAKGT